MIDALSNIIYKTTAEGLSVARHILVVLMACYFLHGSRKALILLPILSEAKPADELPIL